MGRILLIIIVLIHLGYLAIYKVDWIQLINKVKNGNFYFLLGIILLMPINWLLESAKWKILLQQTYKIDQKRSLHSILAGVAIGSMTPNRIGSFIGRLFWLPASKRLDGTIHTFYSNGAQLLTTLSFGAVSLIFFKNEELLSNYITVTSLFFYILFLIFLYLFYSFPVSIWKGLKKFFGQKGLSKYDYLFRWEQRNKFIVLLLSFSRYGTFLIQFLFAVLLLEIPIGIMEAVIAIAATFLFTTFIPSLFFGKLLIREGVAVFCFALFIDNSEIVIISSLLIWLVNIFLPALTGAFLLSRIRKKSINKTT